METLYTKRLTLRPVRHSDAPAIAKHISNLNVSRMLARIPHPYPVEESEQWVERVAALCEAGFDLIYALDIGELIGIASLNKLEATPTFAYWLAESQWGNGFATEACGAALDHAFKAHPIIEIKSSVFCDNEASLRLQKRIGFKVTGTSSIFSLARNANVESVETSLTLKAFKDAKPSKRQLN